MQPAARAGQVMGPGAIRAQEEGRGAGSGEAKVPSDLMTSVTSAGILNAAVARVSAARNDITAAEAPQKWGEAAKVGGIYI